jgi:hypothetical protein
MSSGLFLEKKDKNMLIVITVLIFVLVSDTMINQVSDFLVPQLISNFGVGLFCAFAIIVGISQYFILDYVKRKIDDQYTKSLSTRFLHKLVSVIQYSLVAILVLLVLQILSTASYSSYTIIALSAISYLLSIALMTYFAKKFLSWHLANKQSIIVLLYAVSFALVAIGSSIALTMDLYNFATKPTEIFPTSLVEFPSYPEGSAISILDIAYGYVDLLSFLFVWGATVLLLHEYIHKWRLRHWILVCVPLIYFLSTLLDYAGIYVPSSDSEWLTYYLYASLNSTAGGLLFGFAFLVIARNIHNNTVKGYMIISAYGFLLLFISNQVTLIATSYPPFGAATILCFGLSSYLILVGLYVAALSVSQDAGLRKSIRKSILNKSKLLGSIGQAEMQQEVEKWVRTVDKTDTAPAIIPSMTKDDIRLYIQEILSEVKKRDVK